MDSYDDEFLEAVSKIDEEDIKNVILSYLKEKDKQLDEYKHKVIRCLINEMRIRCLVSEMRTYTKFNLNPLCDRILNLLFLEEKL